MWKINEKSVPTDKNNSITISLLIYCNEINRFTIVECAAWWDLFVVFVGLRFKWSQSKAIMLNNVSLNDSKTALVNNVFI